MLIITGTRYVSFFQPFIYIQHLFDYLQAILFEELNFNVCCVISRLPASVLKKA